MVATEPSCDLHTGEQGITYIMYATAKFSLGVIIIGQLNIIFYRALNLRTTSQRLAFSERTKTLRILNKTVIVGKKGKNHDLSLLNLFSGRDQWRRGRVREKRGQSIDQTSSYRVCLPVCAPHVYGLAQDPPKVMGDGLL